MFREWYNWFPCCCIIPPVPVENIWIVHELSNCFESWREYWTYFFNLSITEKIQILNLLLMTFYFQLVPILRSRRASSILQYEMTSRRKRQRNGTVTVPRYTCSWYLTLQRQSFIFRQETADLPSENRQNSDLNSVVENPMTMDHLTVVTKMSTLDE